MKFLDKSSVSVSCFPNKIFWLAWMPFAPYQCVFVPFAAVYSKKKFSLQPVWKHIQGLLDLSSSNCFTFLHYTHTHKKRKQLSRILYKSQFFSQAWSGSEWMEGGGVWGGRTHYRDWLDLAGGGGPWCCGYVSGVCKRCLLESSRPIKSEPETIKFELCRKCGIETEPTVITTH